MSGPVQDATTSSGGSSEGSFRPGLCTFMAEWDEEGVFLYQAFNSEIADWALEHQQFGGPGFNPTRMTWVKPSFAWVLYRSGYGRKHNQERILKIKVPHAALAKLLARCSCKHGGGGSLGRVQWDPARDLLSADGREPRKRRDRAIQIGLKGRLSELYVQSVLSIQDCTDLAHDVGKIHSLKDPREVARGMEALKHELPVETPYMPPCDEAVLKKLLLQESEPGDSEAPRHAPHRVMGHRPRR
eukprot:CAMPEP_0194757966 /NCGR_PEP_ID=MMETSP0323_2-20130528/11350_1 /TAXON_ID=2866 ORGANISM="Crypthecodinium cohnii, Strain Seligo" /NCGR_SAMPLE_ID=MMETSP0323_2 /ASSEMBLY_ACC=CAM_ASM_000346 /LENGTH=242 /DNA_ID=CAMNT_0039678113 /DNA_START=76 /DNA_END=804 /DNA_ORIENTATION=+